MFYVAGWLSSSGLSQTTINFKAELCWLVCGSTETPCTVDNQLKIAADQQSPCHHANCARHRLSKSGCGLNMWACTSGFPPNPISPDKTLICTYNIATFLYHEWRETCFARSPYVNSVDKVLTKYFTNHLVMIIVEEIRMAILRVRGKLKTKNKNTLQHVDYSCCFQHQQGIDWLYCTSNAMTFMPIVVSLSSDAQSSAEQLDTAILAWWVWLCYHGYFVVFVATAGGGALPARLLPSSLLCHHPSCAGRAASSVCSGRVCGCGHIERPGKEEKEVVVKLNILSSTRCFVVYCFCIVLMPVLSLMSLENLIILHHQYVTSTMFILS